MDCDSSISQFDALQRDDVLEPLAQCIGQLPPTQKTVLAMYYHENLEPTEIAACLGLTECEIDQVRAQTIEFLQTRLTAQIGLAGLPETNPSIAGLEAQSGPGRVGEEPILRAQ
jgi:hypothetical protein